ncbi:MAG: methylenetetrahydrofolate--tRNA-(uracil(54)-C(5))-methyltransferase (FADH(2)-oxidizing) TrmFO [Proteobacteria bacterium]|nr:methylenetetrahydrofolate--tRNA-(uracil(54)-C(5))-methyltransferase (FADH(2)-oxidizing) TrmFO [Pseudomonadota bacterium]
MTKVNIIGAGLAGSEAAWQLASRGFEVEVFEMRDEKRKTFAHRTADFAELVCSNSLRSDDVTTAIGLLHQEMRLLDSLVMRSADANKVPAGSALAVDREGFSKFIENELLKTGKVKISRREIAELPTNSNEKWIIATGPLTSDTLSKSILENSGCEHLAFFDAIAPIIYKDSIDFSKAWFQSRYDKGEGFDYINCPLNKEQYFEFVDDLLAAEKTEFKDWEKDTPYFDGCLPIEVMASRGRETLRFGPMKPVGLTNPHIKPLENEAQFSKNRAGKPYAVIQLRQDNKIGTLYNIVGFQTKMKYGDQQRIFRKIPGLENAEFARFGGIHRNTFINSPKLLDEFLRFKKSPNILFAGQVTGVEGYVESAAMGLLCGIFLAKDFALKTPNSKTAIGALLNHITFGHEGLDFQPMNVNFGLFENLEEKINKANRKEAYSQRALRELEIWKKNHEKNSFIFLS